MGLQQYEPSRVLHHASDHADLNEFDLEGGRKAEPLHIASAEGSLLSFAPEEELRVFSVIEQYEPTESVDRERIDSARPLSPLWRAALVGAVLMAGVSTGLLMGTRVVPERRTTPVQVHPESTAEARSFPTTMPIASAPALSADPERAPRPEATSGPLARLAPDSGQRLGSDELRRAFASLDTQGISFEQCAVRVPALDRVVIRCHARREGELDGDWSAAPPAEWTVDFNRALDRWQVVSAPAL